MSVPGLRELSPPGGGRAASEALRSIYRGQAPPRLRRNTEHVFEVMERLRRLDPGSYRPAASYPDTALGRALQLVAFLLRSGVPLEVAYAELGDFDTHAEQGGAEGRMADLFGDLAGSLAAFWRDLGRLGERVVLLTMTEFGRRVRENGSLGTDHGHGSVALVMGGAVRGGRIVGRWPGLEEDALWEGIDVPAALDYRDLFHEVAAHFGCPDPAAVVPGHRAGPELGVF